MSEKAHRQPIDFDVDLAFDPIERHKQQDGAAYVESRPELNEDGKIEVTNSGEAISPDEYFDRYRAAIADEEGDKTRADYDYEHMSVTELTKKLAKAEFEKDKTTATSVDEVLNQRLKELDKEYASKNDTGGTRSTRPENNAKDNSTIRRKNLRDRVAKLKERELAKLAAKRDGVTEIKDELDGYMPDWVNQNGGDDYDSAKAEADKDVLRAAGEARREAPQTVGEAAAQPEAKAEGSTASEKPQPETGEAAEAPAEEAKPEEAPTAETEVIEPEAVPKTPEETFQKQLAEQVEKLRDPKFVPTPQEYEKLADIAAEIEFLHYDPEVDGHSGMGYFFGDTRLNANQARTLLDKVKTGEWTLSHDNREDVYETVASFEENPNLAVIPWRFVVSRAKQSHKNDLLPLREFLKDLEDDPQSYKRYLEKRLVLDEYLTAKYEAEPYATGLASEAAAEVKVGRAARQNYFSPRRIAANGLRAAARRMSARKKRLQAKEAPETEEQPVYGEGSRDKLDQLNNSGKK